MNYWRTERPIVDAVGRRTLPKATAWDEVVSIVTGADVIVLATLCIIGLLVNLAVMLAVPGSAEVAEALQQLL